MVELVYFSCPGGYFMDKKLKVMLKSIKLNESMLSMLFGIVTVVLIGVLVFRMYQSNKPTITSEAQQTEQPSPSAEAKVGTVAVTTDKGVAYPANLAETYTVKPGDDLWHIAEANYGSGYNYVDIAKENSLKNPSLLAAGNVLKLPKVAVKIAGGVKLEQTKTAAPTLTGDSYTVAKGDSLWSIAVRAYADGYKWTEIAKANSLSNPNVIEAGQVLKLPR